jgi:hypothetical protein
MNSDEPRDQTRQQPNHMPTRSPLSDSGGNCCQKSAHDLLDQLDLQLEELGLVFLVWQRVLELSSMGTKRQNETRDFIDGSRPLQDQAGSLACMPGGALRYYSYTLSENLLG